MSDKQLHLVRHGEVHNPEGVLYGRLPNYRLSELGEQMAEAAAQELAASDREVSRIIASPLERAQQTASPIAERHGLSIATDPDLIESLNIFEGKKVSPGDGALRDPRNWKYLVNPLRPSWGEPYVEVAARMRGAVERARILGAGHEVVCVSHQLPVEILRRAMIGKRLPRDPRKRMCGLASLNTFVFDGDEMVDWQYREPAEQ